MSLVIKETVKLADVNFRLQEENMMWFIIFSIFLMFDTSNGNRLEFKRDENSEIVNYLKILIENYDLKDTSTKDISIFQVNLYERNQKKIADLLEDISKVIPDTYGVLYPPEGESMIDFSFRYSSLVIIISDVNDAVSLNSSPLNTSDQTIIFLSNSNF